MPAVKSCASKLSIPPKAWTTAPRSALRELLLTKAEQYRTLPNDECAMIDVLGLAAVVVGLFKFFDEPFRLVNSESSFDGETVEVLLAEWRDLLDAGLY